MWNSEHADTVFRVKVSQSDRDISVVQRPAEVPHVGIYFIRHRHAQERKPCTIGDLYRKGIRGSDIVSGMAHVADADLLILHPDIPQGFSGQIIYTVQGAVYVGKQLSRFSFFKGIDVLSGREGCFFFVGRHAYGMKERIGILVYDVFSVLADDEVLNIR